MMMMMILI